MHARKENKGCRGEVATFIFSHGPRSPVFPMASHAPPYPAERSKAPDFSLLADDGEKVSLADLRGKKVVLYFYPKDDTPGCTTEACGFRDNWNALKRKGAVVLGVSKDDAASHVRFKERYDLPFTLLSDPDGSTLGKYGVWQEKSLYGKTYWGIARTTFVIDEQGKIAKVFAKVRPVGHAAEVLAAL